MLFLHSNGVGTSRAVRIYKTYGTDAVQLTSENPYRLTRDIRGIGSRTADQIAAKLGIEKTALIRVRAGIAYALTEAMDEGHCGLPAEELIPLTQTLLEVPAELVVTALDYELGEGAVIADDLEGRRCVFLAGLSRAEREIAEGLKALAIGRPPWPAIDADKAIPWVEQRTKLALADRQREAVRVALVSKVLVITGGPPARNAVAQRDEPALAVVVERDSISLRIDDLRRMPQNGWHVKKAGAAADQTDKDGSHNHTGERRTSWCGERRARGAQGDPMPGLQAG
jgi:ATP-dependent exoDNAse (exonuclease V) alpha subunit